MYSLEKEPVFIRLKMLFFVDARDVDYKKLIECTVDTDCPKGLPKCNKMKAGQVEEDGFCVPNIDCKVVDFDCPVIGDACNGGGISANCDLNSSTCSYDNSIFVARCIPGTY